MSQIELWGQAPHAHRLSVRDGGGSSSGGAGDAMAILGALSDVAPPAPGTVNSFYAALMSLGFGSSGLVGNTSFTAFTSTQTFVLLAGAAMSSTNSSPAEMQEFKMLYRATFGNVTADKVHDLMLTGLSHDNKFQSQASTYGILIGVGLIAVILRVFSKLFVLASSFRLDDWLLIIGFLINLVSSVVYVIELSRIGGIPHVWDVPWSYITASMKNIWVVWVCQNPANTIIKLSFLVFFQTLSPSRGFWIACTMTALVTVLGSFITLFLTIFQCTPVRDYWENPGTAKCLDASHLIESILIFTMVSDVMVLAIPVVIVWKMELPFKKKLSVLFLLFLGLLTCIFAAVPVPIAHGAENAADMLVEQYKFGVWSQLVVNVGAIVSCMPAIRAMFIKVISNIRDGKGVHGGARLYAKEILSSFGSSRRRTRSLNQSHSSKGDQRLTIDPSMRDYKVMFEPSEPGDSHRGKLGPEAADDLELGKFYANCNKDLAADEEGRLDAHFNLTMASTTDEGDSIIIRDDDDGRSESPMSNLNAPSGLSPRPSFRVSHGRD